MTRPSPALLVVLAVLLVLGTPAIARAQRTTPIELSWLAPPGCPSRGDVLDEVDRALAHDERPTTPTPARAVVTQESNGWHVDLTIGVESHRAFDAESCRAAADATALILGLAIRPRAGVAASVALASVPLTPPSPPPPSPPVLAVLLSAVVDSASMPSVGAGGELAFAWLPGPFRLEVAGSLLGPQHVLAATPTPEGADLTLLGASVRAGWSLRLGDLTLGPAAGVNVQHLRASGFGGTAAFDQNTSWVEATAGGGGEWSLSRRLALRLAVLGAAPFRRPSLVVHDPAPTEVPLHRVPSLTARAAFGIEIRFL